MSQVLEGTVRLEAAKLLQKYPDAPAVAFRAREWGGRPSIAVNGGRTVPVYWADSVLKFRELLAGASADAPVVILTDLSETDLGDDVLYRLAGTKVRTLGVWEPLMSAFDARVIAPRVRRSEPLGQALLRLRPASGYPPAPNGVLTEDHAWEQLVAVLLGDAPQTAVELLGLVGSPQVAGRLSQIDQALLEDLLGWLRDHVGLTAGPLLACVSSGNATKAVPLGLVCRVVFGQEEAAGLAAAAARLERYFDDSPVDPEAGRALADAAETLVDGSTESDRIDGWLRDAEEILVHVKASDYAWISDYLTSGHRQRVRRFAAALALGDDQMEFPALRHALTQVRVHRLSDREPRRLRAMEMAVRLWLFLMEPEPEIGSFTEAAAQHVAEGGFLDMARESLDRQDPDEELNVALQAIAEPVDDRRQSRSERFAALLASATDADRLGDCLGVEKAIENVLLPLAAQIPMLLIVLDGLSESVFRSLSPDLSRNGWTELGPGGSQRSPMIAALPSVTSYSRASLLSGAPTQGGQPVERAGFEQHFGVDGCALFHKGDLTGNDDDLRSAIADANTRVVGVVVNAIDDQLDKGELLDPDWLVELIQPLGLLLSAAADAGRVVVLAGDHGHVLERDSEYRPFDGGGSRWRPASQGTADNGEVLLQGPRVLFGDGPIVSASIERLRYRKRAAGYHGGATPQEVVAPLAVFSPMGVSVAGWDPTAGSEPSWWLLQEEAIPHAAPEATPSAARRTHVAPDQQQIDIPVELPDEEAGEPSWISELRQSEIYRSRYEGLPRPPDEEYVTSMLIELDRSHGVAAEAAMARALNVPAMRVRGIVASVQQLLNVEGFQVLSRDRDTGEVRLDRDLLRKQFSI